MSTTDNNNNEENKQQEENTNFRRFCDTSRLPLTKFAVMDDGTFLLVSKDDDDERTIDDDANGSNRRQLFTETKTVWSFLGARTRINPILPQRAAGITTSTRQLQQEQQEVGEQQQQQQQQPNNNPLCIRPPMHLCTRHGRLLLSY